MRDKSEVVLTSKQKGSRIKIIEQNMNKTMDQTFNPESSSAAHNQYQLKEPSKVSSSYSNILGIAPKHNQSASQFQKADELSISKDLFS